MRIPARDGVCGVLMSDLKSPVCGTSVDWRFSSMCDQETSRGLAPTIRSNARTKMLRTSRKGIPCGEPSQAVVRTLSIITIFLILITLPHSTLALVASHLQSHVPERAVSGRALNESSPLLQCLQVSPPLSSPPRRNCQQTLMVHIFGSSYGKPYVGGYHPPAECEFNRVTINFTVTSAGRQFDRLAFLFLGDIEIFRTSTAEPTQTGIIWSYVKDSSSFLPLWKEPQKIIFDLGNIQDDTYTGAWNTTLTATFFIADDVHAADVILPVSARKSKSNSPSGFVVPESKAINTLALPQNAVRAIFSISACGQATEEFWWSNVLSSDTQVFGNNTTFYGHSPFRELQLLIDGQLAGVAWPFPIIFTGGIVPGFWRPVVGIDAFDLKDDEIDITAFLPALSDGKEHTFQIRVMGIEDDGHGVGVLTEDIGSNWVVTGKVFLWLGQNNSIAKGTAPSITAPNPHLGLVSNTIRSDNGSVSELNYYVNVKRSLKVKSKLETSSGLESVTWTQNLTFSNDGQFTNNGNDQITKQSTIGSVTSGDTYTRAFEYPLWVFSTYKVLSGGNFSIDGKMGRGKYVKTIGDLAFPSELKTFEPGRAATRNGTFFAGTLSNDWQNGTASYLSVPAQKKSYGSGATEELYSLSGIGENLTTNIQDNDHNTSSERSAELYSRHIIATNGSIVFDRESFDGDTIRAAKNVNSVKGNDKHTFAKESIKAILGRGPF